MPLRLLLVGLVTSLGLELPSDRDVSCWAESGRAWADAKLSELPGRGVRVVPAAEPAALDPSPEPVVGRLPTDADLAFRAASDGVVADFASDWAAMIAAEPASASDTMTVEVIAPASVGLPSGEEIATVVEVASVEVAGSVAVGETPAEVVADDEGPSRADRLSSAVRLTREAVNAWAAVLQEPADEAGCTR